MRGGCAGFCMMIYSALRTAHFSHRLSRAALPCATYRTSYAQASAVFPVMWPTLRLVPARRTALPFPQCPLAKVCLLGKTGHTGAPGQANCLSSVQHLRL